MTHDLRVAMIIQAYYPHVGGAEKQLAALAPRLERRGVDLHILTRRYPGMKPFELIGGVPVHRLPVPGPKAAAALSFTLAALAQLRRLKPDLIHAHELLSPTTTAIAAKKLFNVPVVAKVLRGGVLGDIAKLHSRRSGAKRIAAIRRDVDAFITISREIDRELAGIGVEAGKRVFIPNGVDLDAYRPAGAAERSAARRDLGINGDPVAVFAGRFVPEKRIDALVQVWPAVRQSHPNAGLVLLGDGPEKGKIERLAGSGVHLAGQIDDVRPYLRAADVFILPSSTEGLSNSMLEAMAMGLAAVATQVGGAGDLIEHGRSGWLIPADDLAALEQGVVRLFEDSEARRKMGEEARKVVAQEYALERVAERLVDLYTCLTATKLPVNAVYP